MEPGQRFHGELQITHNCFGQPTVEVTIRLPAGAKNIEGSSAPEWRSKVDEAKGEVIWHGGPEEGRVTLPFAFDVPALAQGQAVYFPVVQRCTGGEVHRWVEIPAAGQTHDDLGFPAAVAVIGNKLALPEGEMADDDHHPHVMNAMHHTQDEHPH